MNHMRRDVKSKLTRRGVNSFLLLASPKFSSSEPSSCAKTLIKGEDGTPQAKRIPDCYSQIETGSCG